MYRFTGFDTICKNRHTTKLNESHNSITFQFDISLYRINYPGTYLPFFCLNTLRNFRLPAVMDFAVPLSCKLLLFFYLMATMYRYKRLSHN